MRQYYCCGTLDLEEQIVKYKEQSLGACRLFVHVAFFPALGKRATWETVLAPTVLAPKNEGIFHSADEADHWNRIAKATVDGSMSVRILIFEPGRAGRFQKESV